MSNILILLKGEMQRAVRYKILATSFVIAAIFIGVLYLVNDQNVMFIFPLVVFIEITMLAMLYMGAVSMFEKHEKTLVSLMVSPVNKREYFISKMISNIINGSISILIICIYVIVFRGIDINILGLIGSIIVISYFHSMLGFVFSLYAKDFGNLLLKMTSYFLIVAIPILLDEIGLITNGFVQNILYLLPTKAAMILVQANVGFYEVFEIYYAILYLIVLGSFLLYFNINKFGEYLAKESGA